MQRLSSVVKEKVEAYVVSGVQEERKIELLDNLSIAVEKVQNKFENPIHNKVVKDGKEVENLCSCLEDIFQHGLREKLFQNSANASENLSFWAVIQKLSMKEDIQSIYRLSIIQTDINRCRAWIRMKLKDHTIGSYIGLLIENSKLLKEHYNSNAFLRDTVKTESVRTLLQYVIASLDFYINYETPQRSFGHMSVDARASPGLSSPDVEVTRVDFQHGEIAKRRRSSRKRTKTPTATIAPIREFDSISIVSSEHSSGRSSRGSSTASPIVGRPDEDTEVKIKFLEGSSVFPERCLKSTEMDRNKVGRTDGGSLDGERQIGVQQMVDFRERHGRSGSSCSSRSRSSNESTKGLDSFLSREVATTRKSQNRSTKEMLYRDQTVDTKTKGYTDEPTQREVTKTRSYSDEPIHRELTKTKSLTGEQSHREVTKLRSYSDEPLQRQLTKTKSLTSELMAPTKTSTPLKGVLTRKQKDEIAEMMSDLKSKSNRPLSTEKILEIIPIHDGMSVDEIKSYLNERLKDYFSMGIISTKNPTNNSVKSPIRTTLELGLHVDAENRNESCSMQSKLKNDLDRKKSLDEFLRRGRTEPPFWSSEISPKKTKSRSIDTKFSTRINGTEAVNSSAEVEDGNQLNESENVDRKNRWSEEVLIQSVAVEKISGPPKGFIESQGTVTNGYSVEIGAVHSDDAGLDDRAGNLRRAGSNDLETQIESQIVVETKSKSPTVENENIGANSEKLIGDSSRPFMTDLASSGDAVEENMVHRGADESSLKTDVDKRKSYISEGIIDTSLPEVNSSKIFGSHNEMETMDGAPVDDVIDGVISGVILQDAPRGEVSDDASTLEASNEMNFVPGICEEVSPAKHSEAKPIKKLRKANTIGPGIARRTASPRGKGSTKSLERDTFGRFKAKSSSSGETGDLLYGFRVESPSLANSTTSSIDTNQGYMFDGDDYVTDSEGETYTSGENSERERIRSLLADLGVNDDIIGLKEDHFSTPDSFMGFTSDEELENAIETCKERIKSLAADSEERKHLVRKLVQLRLKRHEQKEAPPEDVVHMKKILGHQFAKEGKVAGNYFCDSCGSTIWALVHTLYKCQDCSFHCHRKCLKSVDKACVSKKVSGSVYITDIAPESGLATQQYRCADCRRRLIFRDGYFQSRLCDYTGQFYCSNCHWNETQVIPARVVHNWDFIPRKVSRQSKHLLNLLSSKPIISLKEINPALFNFVEDLRDVRALREQILEMKKYLVSCRIAVDEKLLLLLKDRQHFVENSYMYTMQDLVSVNNGKLLEELSRLTATFGKHIKFDCPICQGRGFICEICPSSDVIFPFDFNATTCQGCRSLFHRSCYRKGSCPKCQRKAARKALNESNSSEDSR